MSDTVTTSATAPHAEPAEPRTSSGSAQSVEDTAASSAPGSAGTGADPATRALARPGSLPTASEARAAAKDRTLTSPAAVELARSSLADVTQPLSVGAHAGARVEAERVVTHLFDCTLVGYRGWRWAVTLARPPRARTATVCEIELLPGEDAILAPAWVPWADRLQPGDVARGDRLPRRETDERLEPGWEATGEDEGDVVGTDALDFGRPRVLSPEGVQRAAQRWYDGDHGPEAEGVRKAHATCSSCGFFVPLAGPLRRVFGICANEWAADDGRVVSLDHGCGAHSETDLPDQGPEWPVTPSRLDEGAMEQLGTDGTSLRGGLSRAELASGSGGGEPQEPSSGAAELDEPDEPIEGAGLSEQENDRPDDEAPAQASVRSRRSRRSRGRAAEDAEAGAPDQAPDDVRDEARDAVLGADGTEGPAQEPVGPGEADSPSSTGPGRSAGSGRRSSSGTRGRRSAKAVTAEAPAGGRSRRPEAENEVDGGEQDRRAEALDAVADLTAELSGGLSISPGARGAGPSGAATSSAPSVPSVPAVAAVPTTLAELEAQLPTGR